MDNSVIPSQVLKALEMLSDAGYSAYIVGGAVRDLYMGRSVCDWDITTNALPEQTETVFSDYRYFETGIKHGTITVIIDSMPLEITTYRTESEYSDRRRPDRVEFTDRISDDLSRRDFSCNAIAYNPFLGFVDVFFGRSDIDNKVIRCVGDPTKRFNEDALRILRALRFSSVLGFTIDKETENAIKSLYKLLSFVSSERIFAELKKMLCGENIKSILLNFSEVFFYILPELKPMKDCAQNHERHIFDVWEHTVNAVAEIPADPDLRFAALFHDSGKPYVKSTDENGVDHFYSHSVKSKEIAYNVLNRLKASNAEKKHICSLIEYHDFIPSGISKKTYKKYIGLLGLDTVKELFLIREADVKAQNPEFLEDSLESNHIGIEILNEIIRQDACFTLKDLAVDGRDLIKCGFSPGQKLGETLNVLLSEVMDNKLSNEKNALIFRAKELLAFGNSKDK